jgi:hypothetical protein
LGLSSDMRGDATPDPDVRRPGRASCSRAVVEWRGAGSLTESDDEEDSAMTRANAVTAVAVTSPCWLVLLTASVVALVGCGGSAATPTAAPTPLPTVQPTPTPMLTPGGLPAGMSCNPTPPPMLRMHIKIHSNDEGGRVILDSKPLVPNTDHYCERVGFGSWKFCDTRPEGDLQRVACDYLATGKALDTGRWGPTWYYDDELCSQSTRCDNHATNQFMAHAKNSGTFKACAADTVPVAADGTRCGWIEIN